MSLREFINIINFEKDAIADSLNELLSLNINESLKEYDVAGPAYLENLTEESDYHFRVKTNYFKFRVGEHVDIRMEQQGKLSKSLMECTVTAINFDKIGEVQATLEPTSLGSEIVPETNYYLTQKSMSGIYSRLLKRIKNNPSVASETDLKNLELNPNFLDKLNESQKSAIKFIIANNFKGCIQGPPGTGKTEVIARLVEILIKNGCKVGISAFTHSAVDNALTRILKQNLNIQVARIGNMSRLKIDQCSNLDVLSSFSNINEEHKLVAATMHSWCLTSIPFKPDVLILDEATQIPVYFYPLIKSICANIICIGDPMQFLPILKSKKRHYVTEDIYSYFAEEQRHVPMLSTQYRMNSDVQAWSSEKFYSGKLVSDDSVKNRDILDNHKSDFGSNRVQVITNSARSIDHGNPVEARQVAEMVEKLVMNGIKFKEIGIIVPYRVQGVLIFVELQKRFGANGLNGLAVDTVERFQGQEREIILISFGADGSKTNELNFLNKHRRLNVSMTRARSRTYIFCSEKLIELSTNFEFLSSLFKHVKIKIAA